MRIRARQGLSNVFLEILLSGPCVFVTKHTSELGAITATKLGIVPEDKPQPMRLKVLIHSVASRRSL